MVAWWPVSKNKLDKATKVLDRYNGRVRDYDVQEQIVNLIETSLPKGDADSGSFRILWLLR